MKIYLCGQKYFGQEVFKLLRRLGHDIVGVSSPAWRNERLKLAQGGEDDIEDRLRNQALLNRIPWLEAGQLKEATLPDGVDLIVAAHSHDFIGRATRQKAKLGALSYHPSLLPLHRGRDAIRWAIRLRERVTGGTVFWLNDTVDGGPVAARDWCFIRPDDTAETLWRRELQPMGLRLYAQVLDDLGRGIMVAEPQETELATWEPSFNQPALYRPDLPQLGSSVNGFTVVSSAEQLAELRAAMYQ